jgi:hypothetical protein
MKPASAKAKGRKLQQWVRDALLAAAPDLEPDDVRSTSMGASGEDLLLSPAARRVFPISIECKCQERLNIWDALKQAQANAAGHTPVVFFKRNRSEVFVALPAQTLIDLYAHDTSRTVPVPDEGS